MQVCGASCRTGLSNVRTWVKLDDAYGKGSGGDLEVEVAITITRSATTDALQGQVGWDSLSFCTVVRPALDVRPAGTGRQGPELEDC